MNDLDTIASNPFVELATGPLTGILNWNELDQMWKRVCKDSGSCWYIYKSGEQPPNSTVTEDNLKTTIKSINEYLHESHTKEYCGIAYVDSVVEPTLIKIFDPKLLTSICNIYGKTPLQGWVISGLKPVNLKALEEADSDFQRHDHESGRNLPSVPEIAKMERQYSEDVAQTLDVRRSGCPLPIINTCRALKSLSVNQVLEIVTIEPGALNDIDYICRQTGGSLIALEQTRYGYSFFVRKSSGDTISRQEKSGSDSN